MALYPINRTLRSHSVRAWNAALDSLAPQWLRSAHSKLNSYLLPEDGRPCSRNFGFYSRISDSVQSTVVSDILNRPYAKSTEELCDIHTHLNLTLVSCKVILIKMTDFGIFLSHKQFICLKLKTYIHCDKLELPPRDFRSDISSSLCR
jgi:hypothetical protein